MQKTAPSLFFADHQAHRTPSTERPACPGGDGAEERSAIRPGCTGRSVLHLGKPDVSLRRGKALRTGSHQQKSKAGFSLPGAESRSTTTLEQFFLCPAYHYKRHFAKHIFA